jgi:hypothetical protein
MSKAKQCTDCTRLEEKTNLVRLASGDKVCSYCERWRIECEAKHLLSLPLSERRDQLDARIKQRGAKPVDELKAAMAEIHANRMMLRNSKQR